MPFSMPFRWAVARPRPTLALLIAVALTAPLAPARAALPEPVAQALREAQLSPDSLALMVMPLTGRGPTLTHRHTTPMQPGSTMKLVTSVVALDRLGPNLRGSTELRSAAPIEGDVLRGDLVLRGGGDPDLGVPQLWALLQELRWKGVREIAGDIVLDRSLWRPTRLDVGVPPFDEAPEFPYNGIPDALQLAGNLATLELVADASSISARLLPPLEGVEIDNRLTLGDHRCADWGSLWKTPLTERFTDAQGASRVRVVLQGQFPRQCSRTPQLQLMDRDELALRLLRHLWQQLGGEWRGQLREGESAADARVLARRESRPWGEVLRGMLKSSDNTQTRMLFMTLGVAGGNAAKDTTMPTRDLAAREVHRWFAEQKIDSNGLLIDNGSGLSRSERISPLQLARMLQVALNGKNGPDLLASMPTAGVDGTMRNRLKQSAAMGWARVKTGTLRNVVGLAGVVPDADGRPWVMAAIVNHETANRVGRPVLDALVDWIARSGMTRRGARAVGPTQEGP